MHAFCSTHMVSYVGSSTQGSVLVQQVWPFVRERIVTLRLCLPHLQGMEATVLVKAFPIFSEHVIYGISLAMVYAGLTLL